MCFVTIRILITTASAIAMVGPALAGQGEAPDRQAEQDQEATIGDIVVTAQRRSERLQDVPLSVTALGQDRLDDANIQSAVDIGKLVSGTHIGRQSTSVLPFIRGVGSSQRSIAAEASVATYIDGVYVTRLNPAMLRLNNISRIEVLKGPQGTLFGRNSSGGLIHIVTKTPEPGSVGEFSGEMGYSNYETLDVNAYGAASLGSKAAVDLAFSSRHQNEGWGFNETTQREINYERSLALRSKLVFDVGEATRLTLTGDYLRYKSDIGFLSSYRGLVQGYQTTGPLANQPRPIIGFYDSEANTINFIDSRIWGVSGKIEHELGFATLINTISYRKISDDYQTDADFGRLDTINSGFDDEIATSFLEEIQLQSNPGGPVTWSVGAFYGDIEGKFSPQYLFGDLLAPSIGAGNTSVTESSQRTRTIAGFGQATIALGDVTNLTLGGRVTHDSIRAVGYRGIGVGGAPPAAPVTIIPGSERLARDSYTKVSWRIALDHHLSQDVMAYASASRGFKASIFSLQPLTNTTPASPEIVTAFELGAKSELLDRRLRLNAAIFYNRIRNLQVTIVPAIATLITSNAEGARSYGLELETEAAVSDRLSLRAGYTYINSKYTSYDQAPFFFINPNPPFGNLAPVAGDASGNWTERAPEHSFYVGGEYRAEIGNNATLKLSANYAYTGKFYWHPDNITSQRAVGLLDAQIRYELEDPNIYIALWGSNLTNKKYYIEAVEQGGPTGTSGAPGAPRTYGIKLGYRY